MAKVIASINALAALVEKSAPAVQKWVKHPDWPFGMPPWPAKKLDAIREWAEESLQENRAAEGTGESNAKSQQLSLAKLQKLIRETGILDVKLKGMRGEVHGVAECEARWRERTTFVKQTILTMLPSTAAQEIDARQRSMGKALSVLELAEVITRHAETTLNQYVAKAGRA